MKIQSSHYNDLKNDIFSFLKSCDYIEKIKENCNQIALKNNLEADKIYRWEIFWKVNNNNNNFKYSKLEYLNDNNIDSALKKILSEFDKINS